MANVRAGNTIFIDSTGTAIDKTVKVAYMVVVGHSGAGDFDLLDNTPGQATKMHVEAASGSTVYLDFSKYPILFSEGVVVETATNVHATLVLAGEV